MKAPHVFHPYWFDPDRFLRLIAGLALGCSATFGSVAMAGLEFAQEEIAVEAGPEDSRVTIDFAFSNTGGETIRIVDFDSSCACLSAEAEKSVYAPGEAGVLSAVFELGSLIGEHRKVIYVTDSKGAQYEAAVRINIPEVVRVSTNLIHWDLGSEAESQIIRFEVLGEDPIHVTGVSSTREDIGFTSDFEEIEEGRIYEIAVHPGGTDIPVMGAVKITTDSPIPKYQRKMVFFNVNKPRPEGARTAPLVEPRE